MLPYEYSNQILRNLCGLQLKSQIFGRTTDLIRDIPHSTIISENGADDIAIVIYKRFPFSVVTNVSADCKKLMNTQGSQNESFKNFESRFSAAVAKYFSQGQSIALQEAIKAVFLLKNSKVSEVQRVPVISFAESKASSAFQSDNSTGVLNENFLNLVEYESVSSVNRQFYSKGGSGSHNSYKNATVGVLSGNYVNNSDNSRN